MVAALEEAMYTQLERRAGDVREEDSRNALGVQVADVAAGLAAHEYEAAPGEVRSKAEHVRTMFDRVLLKLLAPGVGSGNGTGTGTGGTGRSRYGAVPGKTAP